MKARNIVLWVAAFMICIGTAAGLSWFQAHRQLGKPGIKATPIPGTVVMNIDLPENVLNYTSTNVPQAAVVTNFLPSDTSYAQRRYNTPEGFWVNANIILMGADRTSIHKPEFCLPGQGWQIVKRAKVNIPIAGEHPYSLEVSRWDMRIMAKGEDGRQQEWAGLYVFWFVADNELTTDHRERMKWLARDLLFKGVLQRWAYISYYTAFPPGAEDAAFERVKELIAASVPEFQVTPEGRAPASLKSEGGTSYGRDELPRVPILQAESLSPPIHFPDLSRSWISE